MKLQFVHQIMRDGIPNAYGTVVMPRGQEGSVVGKCDRRNPGILVLRAEHVARGSVPQRQIVASGRQQSAIGAKGPYGLQIAQSMPFDLLARLGIPAAKDAWLLHGQKRSVRSECHG